MNYIPAEKIYHYITIAVLVALSGWLVWSILKNAFLNRKKDYEKWKESLPMYRQLTSGMVIANIDEMKIRCAELNVEGIYYSTIDQVTVSMIAPSNGFRDIGAYRDIEVSYARDDHEEAKNVRRGMTIASALFNFPIPPSVILIDDLTLRVLKFHLWFSNFNKTYDDHLADDADFIATLRNNWNEDLAKRGVTYEKALTFLSAHWHTIGEAVAASVHGQYYPTVEGVICDAFYRTSLFDQNALGDNERYIRIGVMVALRLYGVKFPLPWLMVSDISDQLYDHAFLNKPFEDSEHEPLPNNIILFRHKEKKDNHAE